MEKIEINPKNKGKFTATQKKTGKSTEELCHSKNKKTRKRANFARMAKRHWKPLNESKINSIIKNTLNDFLISEGYENNINESLNRHVSNVVSEFLNEDRVELQGGEIELDNFQNVLDIIKFTKPGDTLYFVQILKRKKDNPSMHGSLEYIKQFYLKSEQEFKNAENQIKNICKTNNARAYIYLNARSKAVIDKYTKIYAQRFSKHHGMAKHFGYNPMAVAAGRSFDEPDRPLCFIDIDSDDFNDIKKAMKIIQDAGIKPLFAYRSLNNGLHIILPNKEDAKKLDFSSINGDLSGLSQFYKNNAKVSLEIDKPTLLYACLKPNGYGKQQARFQQGIQQRDKNKKHP